MKNPDRVSGARARAAVTALAALAAGAALAAATLVFAAVKTKSPHGPLREECAVCHGPQAWTPARISPQFDHGKYAFPLEGAHAATACMSCHTSLRFSAEATACASCHADVHRGEFGTDCARCHGSRSFIDRASMVRAHRLTRFPLTGSHIGLECEECHTPVESGHLRYVGTDPECASCHLRDYRAAKSPDHVAGDFPLECRTCHTTASFPGAAFDHSRTAFPLVGVHRSVACGDCHKGGVFAGTSQACVSCHRADYDATTNPNHVAAGFPTECATCHTPVGWTGATFDHNTTPFPLVGKHVGPACGDCHANNVFAGTSQDCESCHRAAYDATADPNHAAAGIEPLCASCHTPAGWPGARIEHDPMFPIYSGTHRGRWDACSTCHTTNTDYQQFTCFSCHPHDDRTSTDGHHSNVSGYSYDSHACYSCHPDGRH